MKIDFTATLTDLQGNPLPYRDQRTNAEGKKEFFERDFTLRDACVNALLSEPADRNAPKIDGKEKIRLFRLADKIFGCHEAISLDVETISLLKDKIAASYSTLVTGRVWELLDPSGDDK